MSMRFNSEVSLISLDVSGYSAHLNQVMTDKVKEAARSWLRTVLVIIPTWSGASRATFQALAAEVGFNVTFGPIRSRKDRRPLGRATGRGGLEIDSGRSWKFFYETDLRYLAFNEFNQAVKGVGGVFFGLRTPTPFKFLEAGRKDFESFASTVRLPSPMEFIRGNRIG